MIRSRTPQRFVRTAFRASTFLLLGAVVACGDNDRDDAVFVGDTIPLEDRPMAQLLVSPETHVAPAARLEIVSPGDGQRFAEGDSIPVQFNLGGFELRASTPSGDERGLARAPDGQHIHLIVNDRSYRAIYDIDQPVMVGGLSAGTHVIRAFPGRDWHESVKTPESFAQVLVVVGDDEPDLYIGPVVVYSRPQGVYEGADADSILVDFYVDNIELGEDAYQVLFTLDGDQTFRITEWQPYLLVGLDAGEHTLRMELFDELGEPVETPYLPVERTFEIRR